MSSRLTLEQLQKHRVSEEESAMFTAGISNRTTYILREELEGLEPGKYDLIPQSSNHCMVSYSGSSSYTLYYFVDSDNTIQLAVFYR
jgi:hypothetical protein